MRRIITSLAIAILAAVPTFAATGQALRNHPYRGDGSKGGSFHIAIKDTLIGTTWERVTADTGFTQMGSDTTLTWQFANDSQLDSLRDGKLRSGAPATAVWGGGSTRDTTTNSNFFQDNPSAAVASVGAVFGNGWSFAGNNYLLRRADTDFQVAGNWLLTIWANSRRTANPSASRIVYSVYTSPDIVQIGFDANGNVFGRISDDGRSTWDSIGLTADRYDSAWHLITLQTVSTSNLDSLRITADRLVSASVKFSNSATSLTIDTVNVGGFRAASTWLGRLDEAYFIEDTVTFDRDMKLYTWLRGRESLSLSSDSVMIYYQGIRQDSIFGVALDTIKPGTPAVSDSEFSIFEAAFLDTIESLPLMLFVTGSSPRGSKLDSIPTGAYFFNPAVIGVGKYEHLVIDNITFTAPDPAMIDSLHFQVRVYPEWKRAQGAGTNYYVLPGAERSLSAGTGDVQMFGPWTIQGPAVVEIWAKARAANSIGQVELNGFRGKYGR